MVTLNDVPDMPVEVGTCQDARNNIQLLIEDAMLSVDEPQIIALTGKPRRDGRYEFYIRFPGKRVVQVAMPGTPLERDKEFPRVFVETQGWKWRYAILALQIAAS